MEQFHSAREPDVIHLPIGSVRRSSHLEVGAKCRGRNLPTGGKRPVFRQLKKVVRGQDKEGREDVYLRARLADMLLKYASYC